MARVTSRPDRDTVYYEAGSQEHIDDLIRNQDAARANQPVATTAKSWAPWVIGGLVVAGAAYLFMRND